MVGWQDDWITVSEAEFLSRDRDFANAQNKIMSQATFHGAINSSGVGLSLYELLNREIDERAKLIVEFKESISTLSDLTYEQMEGCDAKAEEAMQKTYRHLFDQTRISSYLASFNLKGPKDDSELALGIAITKAKINIKRAGETAMKKQKEGTSTTNVTIQGHGNVVQVGTRESIVGLTFSPTMVQSLSDSFSTLADAIDQSSVPEAVILSLAPSRADLKGSAAGTNSYSASTGGSTYSHL